MASQADLFARWQQYLQALNPLLQPARDGNLWNLGTAFTMSMADTQAKIDAAALQQQLSTATGDYLTALCADRGVYRKPATAYSAPGVFSVTAAAQAAITYGAGALVQTVPAPGQAPIVFKTLADATIPAGQTTSNSVTVQALVPGSSGIVAANQITVVLAGSGGVSFTNTAPTAGGSDGETGSGGDALLRARTYSAIAPANSPALIQAAAESASPNVFAARVVDAQDGRGSYTCYASDSSGALSQTAGTDGLADGLSLYQCVYNAIAAVDGIGLTRSLQALSVISQTVAANMAINASYNWSSVVAQVQAAIATYMAALQPGAVLHPSDLTLIVFGALPNTTAVPGVVAFYPITPAAPVIPTSTQMIRLSGTATLSQVTN